VKCPADISLISAFDSELCQLAVPPITAIERHLEKHGRLAIEILLRHVGYGGSLPSAGELAVVPADLVIRESCGPCP
jgi:DNA-binding LacI/PurR family transcriptional regulator